jgi:hypothetical protein
MIHTLMAGECQLLSSRSDMLREEEDDMTQEMRQLIMLEVKLEIDKAIQKIESAKVPVTDEWTEGVNAGLGWAVRILSKDKSAS